MEGKLESEIGGNLSPKLGGSCARFRFQICGDRRRWQSDSNSVTDKWITLRYACYNGFMTKEEKRNKLKASILNTINTSQVNTSNTHSTGQ